MKRRKKKKKEEYVVFFFFFFKQKTAYEIKECDWSSDVCSSDLRLMNVLANDHLAKLTAESADPDVLALMNRYEPVFDDFITKYDAWMLSTYIYKTGTALLYNMLDQLGDAKIKQWEAGVRVHYLENTPEYQTFFHAGRAPFQTGAIDDRIRAVSTFAQSLVGYPVLDSVRIDANTFYLNLNNARMAQQQKEQVADGNSQKVEQARIILGEMMYKNLGVLMDKYGDNPQYVNTFWEFELIMRTTRPSDDDDNVLLLIANLTTAPYRVEVGLEGLGDFEIDWNDGTIEPVTLNNNSQFLEHIYSEAGTKMIKIRGPLDQLAEVHSNSSQLTDALIPLIATALVALILQNNNLNADAVNTLLVTLDGMELSNAVINLIGNASPTGDGITAMNNLIARGCTVLVS